MPPKGVYFNRSRPCGLKFALKTESCGYKPSGLGMVALMRVIAVKKAVRKISQCHLEKRKYAQFWLRMFFTG